MDASMSKVCQLWHPVKGRFCHKIFQPQIPLHPFAYFAIEHPSTQVFYVVEAGEVKDQDYMTKMWIPGNTTDKGCDRLNIENPTKPFLFGYTLLARYENNFWNPKIGNIS